MPVERAEMRTIENIAKFIFGLSLFLFFASLITLMVVTYLERP